MLREKRSLIQESMLASDMVITVISFFIAYWLRSSSLIKLSWFAEPPLYPLWTSMKVLVLLLPLWWLLFHRLGRYTPVRVLGRYTFPLLPVLKANVLGLLVVISIGYFLKVAAVSRALVLIFIFVNCFLLAGWRVILLAFLQRVYFHESDFRHVLIVGDQVQVAKLNGFAKRGSEWGVKVVEVIGREKPEQLAEILQRQVVDDVVFAVSPSRLNQIEEDLAICEQMGVGIHITADWFRNLSGRAWVDYLFGVPMLTLGATRRRPWQLLVKRTADLFLSAAGLLALLPLMLVIAVIIKVTSPGPLFFTQVRCGLNGRHFKLIKFRSMIKDAEKMLDKLKERNEMSGPVFKIKDDPRLTPIGKFLRKTSLDELPQLFNVIRDDMSLVGPRPPLPEEVKKYAIWQRRRLSVKPGITCLWQISGRNELNFNEWMRLDMHYIDNWSFWLDVKILFLTIPAVLLQRGAR